MEKEQFELLSQYLNPDNLSSKKSKIEQLESLASNHVEKSLDLLNNLRKAPHLDCQINDTFQHILSSYNEAFSTLNSEISSLGSLLTLPK